MTGDEVSATEESDDTLYELLLELRDNYKAWLDPAESSFRVRFPRRSKLKARLAEIEEQITAIAELDRIS